MQRYAEASAAAAMAAAAGQSVQPALAAQGSGPMGMAQMAQARMCHGGVPYGEPAGQPQDPNSGMSSETAL